RQPEDCSPLTHRLPRRSSLFPYTTLFRSADALLGAAGLGDLGGHFPDTDPRWSGADSLQILAATAAMVRDAGWTIGNVDVKVVRSEEHTSELQSRENLVCRHLLEKKKKRE